MTDDLLFEIREFLSRSGISASYFGKLACNNTDVVKRLEGGKTVTLTTAARCRQFIAENPNLRHRARQAAE